MVSVRKALLSSLLLSALFSGSLVAQVKIADIQRNSSVYNEWGIMAGGNFQELAAFPFVRSYSPGAVAGAYIKKRIGLFAVQAGLNVTSAHYETELPLNHKYQLTGNTFKDTDKKGIFDALYVNVPVIAEIRPLKHLALQMGVSYSYMAYINDNNGAYSKDADVKKLFASSNVSGIAGFEIDLSQKIKFAARYSVGFMDVNNHSFQGLTDKWLTSSGTASLSYRIKKWYPNTQHPVSVRK